MKAEEITFSPPLLAAKKEAHEAALLTTLVGFSRIYLDDHYPDDALSGLLSGITLAEITQQMQRVVVRAAGRLIDSINWKKR